jgi:cytochrome c
MKSSFGYQRIFIGLLALALAQLACNFGVQPSTTAPQQAPTGEILATQPPTSIPQATQPPTSIPQATQPPSATSSPRGTPDEAKTMLQKAIDHYNAVGRKQALADFTGRVAPFFYLDLYVACIDSNLTQSANGGFPDLVGSPIQPLSRAAWDAATTNKVSSIDYMWIDPANDSTELKTFYYEKVGSDVCGVGVYHP